MLIVLQGMAVGGASEEKQGELNLALTYNDHVQRLLVGIIEGRNIKAGTDSGSAGINCAK